MIRRVAFNDGQKESVAPQSPFAANRRFLLCTLFLLLYSIPLTGCRHTPDFDTVYRRITERVLVAGMDIPRPTNDPILTISGELGTTNLGETIVMDRATIEQVGIVEYDVLDPFEEQTVTYRGVLMRDLLDLWQIGEDVTEITFVALNDYEVSVPVKEFNTYPVLFALQADQVYMEPNYRGPAMLVFPVDDYEFDILQVRRWWIWQIAAIEVRE